MKYPELALIVDALNAIAKSIDKLAESNNKYSLPIYREGDVISKTPSHLCGELLPQVNVTNNTDPSMEQDIDDLIAYCKEFEKRGYTKRQFLTALIDTLVEERDK